MSDNDEIRVTSVTPKLAIQLFDALAKTQKQVEEQFEQNPDMLKAVAQRDHGRVAEVRGLLDAQCDFVLSLLDARQENDQKVIESLSRELRVLRENIAGVESKGLRSDLTQSLNTMLVIATSEKPITYRQAATASSKSKSANPGETKSNHNYLQ